MKKKVIITICACMLVLLFGCGKNNEVEIVGVSYPEAVPQDELKDIFEYSFDSTWSDYENELFNKIKKYDVIHKQLTCEYWEMLGIVQAGFDKNSDVWVNLSENGYTENRSLDMSYGFYENGFQGVSNLPDLRIWTSPDGARRIIRGLNRKSGKTMLMWQENDGTSVLIANDLRLGNYDIQCTWSGDGKCVFVRSLPNDIFPEKDIIKTYGADDYEGIISGATENILLDKIKYGELWKIEKSDKTFLADCIFKADEADSLKTSMVSSDDGSRVLLYMGDAYEAVLTEADVKSRHTATYIKQDTDGSFRDYEILHFNSKVNYTDITLNDNGISVVTDDGRLILWNPETAEQISTDVVIDGVFDVCAKVPDKNILFVGNQSYVYRYYLDNDGEWKHITLYISPQGSSLLKIKYDEESNRLLLLYMIDDSVRNTQRFEIVCLQLF